MIFFILSILFNLLTRKVEHVACEVQAADLEKLVTSEDLNDFFPFPYLAKHLLFPQELIDFWLLNIVNSLSHLAFNH